MMLGRHFLLVSPYLFRTFLTSNRADFDARNISLIEQFFGENFAVGRGNDVGRRNSPTGKSFVPVLISI